MVNVRELVIERERRNIGVQSWGKGIWLFIFQLSGPGRLPSMGGEFSNWFSSGFLA